MNRINIILLVLFSIPLCGQVIQDTLYFSVSYRNNPLELDTFYPSPNSEDSIMFTKLKFYISDIVLINSTGTKQKLREKYYLYDLNKDSILKFPIDNVEQIHTVKFAIGVDSLTNVNGAHGGVLDPQLGMYWTWNSGYINFKLEGLETSLKTRKNKFQFHLGGYQAPYTTYKSIQLRTDNSSNKYIVDLPIDNFIKQIQLDKNHTIMSPSLAAMHLSNLLAKSFFLR